MRWSIALRAIALLKRIALALEKMSDSSATQARIATERWERENVRRMPMKGLKPGVLNLEEAEKLWKERHGEQV